MKFLTLLSAISILSFDCVQAQSAVNVDKNQPTLLKPIEQEPNKIERTENKAANQIEQSNTPQLLRSEDAVQDPNAAPQNSPIVPPPAILKPLTEADAPNSNSQVKTEKAEVTKTKAVKKSRGKSLKN